MEQKTYGYVRVSSKDQNEARQLDALTEYPIPLENIFVDKKSGKDFERPAWHKMLSKVREGDLLVVKSIDRLGRNYDDIIEQWQLLTKEMGIHIRILDMPLLDTRIQGKDLTGTFIADLVLQILSYVAQTERENIRQRQKEGIAAAKLRGVRFGRPRKPVPENFLCLKEQWEKREVTSRQAAKELHIAQDTFLRWVREQKNWVSDGKR